MTIGRDPQREQLELFHAFSGELPARDAQDLMAYPFFSLAKSKRTVPIDFHTSSVTVRVASVITGPGFGRSAASGYGCGTAAG